MQVQPRLNPLSRSDFFPDQRSEPARLWKARWPAASLRADTYFYTGKMGNNPGDYMPFPVTKEVLERGRERYNIYCFSLPLAAGRWQRLHPFARIFARKPPSYHIPACKKRRSVYFYDVITNGFGIMLDYSAQVPPRDRWAIVAYMRALQLSQNATRADVPAGQAVPSDPPKFRSSASSHASGANFAR
jgi:hypothetical protein